MAAPFAEHSAREIAARGIQAIISRASVLPDKFIVPREISCEDYKNALFTEPTIHGFSFDIFVWDFLKFEYHILESRFELFGGLLFDLNLNICTPLSFRCLAHTFCSWKCAKE